MTFIYGAERKKFEKTWAITEALYRKHGMSESAIQEMREYDWDLFKAARIEAIHTQEIGFQPDNDDDMTMMDSPLLMKFFERFTTQYDTHGSHSRYWWLEELSDPRLVTAILRLTDDDKELLTLIVVEGYTQEECAVKLHISQRGISYRMQAVFGKFTEK
jgi:hypothetical protein